MKRSYLHTALLTVACGLPAAPGFAQAPGYTVSTLVPFSEFSYFFPQGMAVDSSGNLYIAAGSTVVRVTTAGKATVVAGGGPNTGFVGDGGPATSAVLNNAQAVALDSAGNLYIADSGQNRIRKVTTDGKIATIAGPGSTNGALGDGGPAIDASLDQPGGVAVDSAGNVYIADYYHFRVRKVTTDGLINTVAGTGSDLGALGDGGPATGATINGPAAVKVDASGNLFIADYGDNRIRQVTPAGIISTVAGDGTRAYSGDGGLAAVAALAGPSDVAVDSSGNLAIADTLNAMIRLVTSGAIYDIAGNGTAVKVWFQGEDGPAGVAFGSGGKIYIASDDNVYVLTPTGNTVLYPPSIAYNGYGYTVFSASAFGGFPEIAPGGWIEIYGSWLAPDSRQWGTADFNGSNAPTSLDGVSVTIGGQPAYISYISPGQINAQVPTNIGTGAQPLVIATKVGKSGTYSVTVNAEEPGLLAPSVFCLQNSSGYCEYQYAGALFSDGATFVLPPGAINGLPSERATAGDNITLYGVGFGPVSPSVSAGVLTPSTNSLALPLKVLVGGVAANVTYAGLAPGAVGLYQINIVIPKIPIYGNPPEPVQLTFTLDGVESNQNLYLALQ